MSDHRLVPLTALGKDAPIVETIGVVTIGENTSLAIASLSARKGKDQELRALIQPVLGDHLPQPGHAIVARDVTAVWTGVDQWFLMAPLPEHPDFAAEIKALVADTASVTEQTDGWVVFDITGANLIPFLERLCSLDTKAMMAGDATRCLIEHLGCLILCRESARSFTLLGPRSSAASLHHTLVTAARSIA